MSLGLCHEPSFNHQTVTDIPESCRETELYPGGEIPTLISAGGINAGEAIGGYLRPAII